MGNLVIKVNYSGLNFEIEGESDIVREMFSDFKNEILSKLIITEHHEVQRLNSLDEEIDVDREDAEKIKNYSHKSSTGKKTKSKGNGKIGSPILVPLDSELANKLKKEYEIYDLSSLIDKVTVLFYLYQKFGGDKNLCDENLAFTLLRTVDVKPPKSVIQTLRDAKDKKNFFDYNTEEKSYILTHIGESFAIYDAKKKSSEK